MGVVNFWGDPCPVCKLPITDRDSQYAVLCAKCINDAMHAVLSRGPTAVAQATSAEAAPGTVPTVGE